MSQIATWDPQRLLRSTRSPSLGRRVPRMLALSRIGLEPGLLRTASERVSEELGDPAMERVLACEASRERVSPLLRDEVSGRARPDRIGDLVVVVHTALLRCRAAWPAARAPQ